MAVRLSNLPWHQARLMNSDAALFLAEARRALEGGPPLDPLWPPLYPLAAAWLASGPGGDLESSALTLAIVAGCLLPVPVFFLGRALFEARAGAFGAIATALLFPVVYWSCQAYPETLFALALYTLLALLWHTGPPTAFATRYPSAGLAAGCAYLLRPEGMLVAGLLFVWLLADRGRELPATRRAAAAALFLGAFAVLATPYLWQVRQQLGRWSVSGKAGWNLHVGDRVLGQDYDRLAWSLTPDGKEVASQRAMRELTLGEVIAERPGELARRYAVNVRRLLGELLDLLELPLVALAVVGLVAPIAERRRLLYLAIAVAPLAAVPLYFVNPRFVIYALPALALLAGRGAAWVAAMPFRRRATGSLVYVALTALCLLPHAQKGAAVAAGGQSARDRLRQGQEYERVGRWMKANVPAGSRTTNVWVAFHAGLDSVQVPFGGYHEVLAYLRSRGCDYLVVDRLSAEKGWLPESSPAFAFLLGTERPPDGLSEVFRWAAGRPDEVRVYALR